eukprot:scaffold291533_cov32-Tisochrysis_lutea.AAC.3
MRLQAGCRALGACELPPVADPSPPPSSRPPQSRLTSRYCHTRAPASFSDFYLLPVLSSAHSRLLLQLVRWRVAPAHPYTRHDL